MNEKAFDLFTADIPKLIEFMEVQRHQHTVMFDGLTAVISLLNSYKNTEE